MNVTSAETDKIIPAFVKALNAIDAIPRTAKVDAGPMKYKFAPLDEVLDAVKPHLRENGLAVTQTPTSTNGVYTHLLHESGQWIGFAPLFVAPLGGTPQNLGSAITYARRYAILSILGAATEDDDGRSASVAATPLHDPVAERVDRVLATMTALDEGDKLRLKAWAEGRSLSGRSLYDKPDWLGEVEAYLDEGLGKSDDDEDEPDEPEES